MAKKIVDVHAHAFDEKIAVKATQNLHKYYGIAPIADGRLVHLLKSAEMNSVDKLILCATATKPTQVEMINTYVSTLVSEHTLCLGTLHPDYENIDDELKRMKELGLLGLKLHPIFQEFKIDEEKALKMFEKIGPDFPVLIHLGDKNTDHSTPIRLSRVMEKFPEITFIGAHLGGYSEWDDAMKYIIGKNLYIDTSSALDFLTPDEAKKIIRLHGIDKVLFGTDYPLSDHSAEIQKLKKLKLTRTEYEKIYWKNAYKLFKL